MKNIIRKCKDVVDGACVIRQRWKMEHVTEFRSTVDSSADREHILNNFLFRRIGYISKRLVNTASNISSNRTSIFTDLNALENFVLVQWRISNFLDLVNPERLKMEEKNPLQGFIIHFHPHLLSCVFRIF